MNTEDSKKWGGTVYLYLFGNGIDYKNRIEFYFPAVTENFSVDLFKQRNLYFNNIVNLLPPCYEMLKNFDSVYNDYRAAVGVIENFKSSAVKASVTHCFPYFRI
jgi:hypothetical protein